MTDIAARIKVIATAAVTWLVAASVFVAVAAPAIAELLPTGDRSAVIEWSVRAAAWLAGAAAIIRRVTPVEPADRGILAEPSKVSGEWPTQ